LFEVGNDHAEARVRRDGLIWEIAKISLNGRSGRGVDRTLKDGDLSRVSDDRHALGNVEAWDERVIPTTHDDAIAIGRRAVRFGEGFVRASKSPSAWKEI